MFLLVMMTTTLLAMMNLHFENSLEKSMEATAKLGKDSKKLENL